VGTWLFYAAKILKQNKIFAFYDRAYDCFNMAKAIVICFGTGQYVDFMNLFGQGYQVDKISRTELAGGLCLINFHFTTHPDISNILFVACDNKSQPVGILWGIRFTDSKEYHIEALYVAPSHQKQGIGKALVDEFSRFVSSKAHFSFGVACHTSNKNAAEFYKHIGGKTLIDCDNQQWFYFVITDD
jgi:GNAT superfamily N-acetyltransferase